MQLNPYVLLFLIYIVFPTLSKAQSSIILFDLNRNDSTVSMVKDYQANNDVMLYVYPNSQYSLKNPTDIKSILAKHENEKIDTLIFSGHYTPGAFSGRNGEIKQQNFLDTLSQHPNLKNNIQHLILRGCYTTRINEIVKTGLWRQSLPNLNYISGYDGRAWSSETLLSQQFITDTLELRSDLLASKSPDEAVSSFKKIRNYDQSPLALWFKTDGNEYYIASESLNRNKPIVDFNKIKLTCNLNLKTRLKYNKLLEQYDIGSEDGFERPPTDTNKGQLRKIYEWLLNNQHCLTLNIWDKNPYDDVSKAAGLLFFNRLTNNYMNVYNQNEFQQMLDTYNAITKDDITIPDLSTASRDEIRMFIYQVSTKIYNIGINGFYDKLDSYIISRINYHLNGLNQLIIKIDPLLTPSRWLTEEDIVALPIIAVSSDDNASSLDINL